MTTDWPAAVADLPVCPHRRLPIPFSAYHRPDGTGDFTLTDSRAAELCARDRLCGVCGKALGHWIAFLGGPSSADPLRGAYTDPPMHEECADASIKLCPYIARQKVPRRSDPVDIPTTEPDGYEPGKSRDWVMVITNDFQVIPQRTADGHMVLLFRPMPAKRLRRFAYTDHGLVEVTAYARAVPDPH